MKERQYSIDIAKAICICLVVIGHFNPSVSNDSWDAVFKAIYSFHMPVFMFLSGILYSYTKQPVPYHSFVWKKFKRLMIPYFSASIVIISIKLIMQNILPVKNTVSFFAFAEMFWKPSAAVHLWFIWVLMILFIVVPLFKSKFARLGLLAASAALWIFNISLPEIFSMNQIPGMAIFFVVGSFVPEVLTGLKRQRKNNPSPMVGWSIIALFVILEVLYVSPRFEIHYLKYILPFTGILAIMIISRWIDKYCPDGFRKIILSVGECSFFIYLFHTTFSEFAKALLGKIGITPSSDFLICLIISTIIGIIAPILIQLLFVEKSKILSILFGVRKKKIISE